MPVTASASKALRRDRHRTQVNRRWRSRVKSALDAFTAKPSAGTLSETYSLLDRAVKHKLIHAHKSARLKSRLTKQLASPAPAKAKPKPKSPAKKTRAVKKSLKKKT